MTWAVTCRNQIVTDHALIALGHHEFAETLRECGERSLVCARAVFADEAAAVACANRMQSTFPEDEVALWRCQQRAEAAPRPGRRQDGDHFRGGGDAA